MQRSVLLLALAAAVVGCKTASPQAGSATASAAGASPRFSWQKDVIATPDANRVAVLAVRADLSLIELSAIEKRDPATRLQLTKGGKNFLVEIIKADDKSAVVAILPGQSSVPEVAAGDDLGLAVVAQ
jgi:hypothetical protein